VQQAKRSMKKTTHRTVEGTKGTDLGVKNLDHADKRYLSRNLNSSFLSVNE
jgi:hypothetical protein